MIQYLLELNLPGICIYPIFSTKNLISMHRTPLLAHSHWKHIKEADFEVAVLPWGATEAHNYHLPYGTDIMEAESISAESARMANEKGANIIVLPVIPFGVNTGQHDIKLDINLNPSTQMTILDDIIASLNRHSIKKLVIVNAHGGNDFRQILRELGLKYPEMWLFQANFYQIPVSEKLFEEPDDHAGEMETSLMLYLFPQHVLPLSEAGDGASKKIGIKALQQKWAWTEREWSKVTNDTGVGNPYKATAAKGEKYFMHVTSQLTEMLVEISDIKRDEAYQ